jgi:hypothetical protein
VQLVDGTGVWGHTFRAFGFPAGADSGMWASGTLPGPRIAAGFSGAPVWDDDQDGVVGMTMAVHRGQSTA